MIQSAINHKASYDLVFQNDLQYWTEFVRNALELYVLLGITNKFSHPIIILCSLRLELVTARAIEFCTRCNL